MADTPTTFTFSGAAHYREAEQLDAAAHDAAQSGRAWDAEHYNRRALTHATLALAAAQALTSVNTGRDTARLGSTRPRGYGFNDEDLDEPYTFGR